MQDNLVASLESNGENLVLNRMSSFTAFTVSQALSPCFYFSVNFLSEEPIICGTGTAVLAVLTQRVASSLPTVANQYFHKRNYISALNLVSTTVYRLECP